MPNSSGDRTSSPTCWSPSAWAPTSPSSSTRPAAPETVVAILAVLAAGGCFVPVDLDQPAERLARIVRGTAAHR